MSDTELGGASQRVRRRPGRAHRAAIGLIGLVIAAQGCSRGADEPGDGRLSVVASFYPVYEAAATVGGSRLDVANLTPAGVEPHDLELDPGQVDQILDADVVLYLGGGFQPAVEDTVDDRDGPTVDLLAGLSSDLIEAPPGSEEPGADPHLWLDPVLMGRLVEEVADALTAADPAGSDTYAGNAAAYGETIRQLDQRYATGLATCQRRIIVTAHAAFSYLAARYDLRQEAIAGIDPETEPDPARLAELTDLVEAERVTTIFAEELVSPAVAETLAREAGVEVAVLNPLEGLTAEEAESGATYVTVMDENLAVLSDALECG